MQSNPIPAADSVGLALRRRIFLSFLFLWSYSLRIGFATLTSPPNNDPLLLSIKEFKTIFQELNTTSLSYGTQIVNNLPSRFQYEVFQTETQGHNNNKHEEDLYFEGVGAELKQVFLFGVQKHGNDAASFCAGLMKGELEGNHKNHPTRLSVFLPTEDVKPIKRAVVSIPSKWFRLEKKNEFTMIYCLKGSTYIRTERHLIFPNRCNDTGGSFYECILPDPPENMALHSAALLLDDVWNNLYVVTYFGLPMLTLQIGSKNSRSTITRVCNRTLGVNQPCCLWPFDLSVTVHGPDGMTSRSVKIHRCIGSTDNELVEDMFFPFPNEAMKRALMRGGMSRRLINPEQKACREVRFRHINVTVQVTEKLMEILELDAVECGIIY